MALQAAPEQENLGRFIAASFRLFLDHGFKFLAEFEHDIVKTHVFKTFHQQRTARFQVGLGEFNGQIDQMFHARGVRRGDAGQVGRRLSR